MFGEEPAYKNRPHDIGQAPKRNGEANKAIDLNLQKQFVGSPGGNRILNIINISAPFLPSPFGWFAPPKFTRV